MVEAEAVVSHMRSDISSSFDTVQRSFETVHRLKTSMSSFSRAVGRIEGVLDRQRELLRKVPPFVRRVVASRIDDVYQYMESDRATPVERRDQPANPERITRSIHEKGDIVSNCCLFCVYFLSLIYSFIYLFLF